jgi:hypothetical protein
MFLPFGVIQYTVHHVATPSGECLFLRFKFRFRIEYFDFRISE